MPPIEVSPTIYIGLGGTGIRFIQALKRQLYFQRSESSANQWMVPFTRLLTIDTAPIDLNQELEDEEARRRLRDERFINKVLTATNFETNFHAVVPEDIIRDVIEKERDQFSPYKNWYEWFDIRSLAGHDQIEHGAAQKRMLGRFCFSANFFPIRKLLNDVIRDLADAVAKGKDESCQTADSETYRLAAAPQKRKVRFVVVGGLAGGTGSGFFLDVCYLLRHFQKHRPDDVASSAATDGDALHFYGFLDTLYEKQDDKHENKEKKACNCYGALQDLNHFNQYDGRTSENLDRRCLPTDPFRPFTERRGSKFRFRWNWGNSEAENEKLNWIETNEPIADRVFLIGKDDLDRRSTVSQYEAVEMAATHAIAVRTTDVFGLIKVKAVNGDDQRKDFARQFNVGDGDDAPSPFVQSPRFRAFGVTRSRVADRELQLSVAALRGDLALERWLGSPAIGTAAEALPLDRKWSEDLKSAVTGCTDPESLLLHFPADLDPNAFHVEDSDAQPIAVRGLPAEITENLDKSIAEHTQGQHRAAWYEELFGSHTGGGDMRTPCRLVQKSIDGVLADLDATERKINESEYEIVALARKFKRTAETHRRQSIKLARIRSGGILTQFFAGECAKELEYQLAAFMADLKQFTRQAIDLYAWNRCKTQRRLMVLPVLSEYRSAIATLKDAFSKMVGDRETLTGLTPFRTLFDKLVPAKRPHMWDQVSVRAGFSKDDDGYVGAYEEEAQAKIASWEKSIRGAALNAVASMDPSDIGSPMNTALAWGETKLAPDNLVVIRDAIFESAFMLRGQTEQRARIPTKVAEPPDAVPQLPTHLTNTHPSHHELRQRCGQEKVFVAQTQVKVVECLAIAMDQVDLSATHSFRKKQAATNSHLILFSSTTKQLGQRLPLPMPFDPAKTANIVCNTLLLLVAGGYNKLQPLVEYKRLDSGQRKYVVPRKKSFIDISYDCFESLGEMISRQHEDEALRDLFHSEAVRVSREIKRWATTETRNFCRAVTFNKKYFQQRGAEAQISLESQQGTKNVDTQTEHYYWVLLEKLYVKHHVERVDADDARNNNTNGGRPWQPLEEMVEWLPVEPIAEDASPEAWTCGLLSLSGQEKLVEVKEKEQRKLKGEEIKRNLDILRQLRPVESEPDPQFDKWQ